METQKNIISCIQIHEYLGDYYYIIEKKNGVKVKRNKNRGLTYTFKTMTGCKKNLVQWLLSDWNMEIPSTSQ